MRFECLGRFRLVSRLERSFVVEDEVVEEEAKTINAST